MWELFDYACGQRLTPALRTEVPRLRAAGQLKCSDEVADKLLKVSPSTIDRLLRHERQVQRIRLPLERADASAVVPEDPGEDSSRLGYRGGRQRTGGLP
jgi:hypothetical protein